VRGRASRVEIREPNGRGSAGPRPSIPSPIIRPREVCYHLLHALDASEGRRRRRKRDTTPDSIGLAIKRELLEGTVRDDPEPQEFEEWLLAQCEAAPAGSGPVQAMASAILEDWRLAQRSDAFRGWLETGAPSEDK
jgi:hypothetical protein